MRHRSSYAYERYARASGSHLNDPFAVDPIRRSASVVALSLAILIVPFMIDDDLGSGVMISVGWLAATGVIFCGPILVWSLIEEGVRLLRRRLHPPIDELRLPARVIHNLQRHGYLTIRDVDLESDTTLVLLSNMESRDVQQIRRAVNLWKYLRWQEQGFPAVGHD